MQKSTIWITGSAGRLGTVLVRLLKAYTDIKVIATDTDLDVTDSEVVKQYASLCRPNVIINCASLSDSAYCEEHMLEAFRVNTIGARNLATAARKANAKIIQLSTDDVFSGKTSPVLTEFGNVLYSFSYEVRDAASGELRAVGHSSHCFIDRSGKVISLKRTAPELFARLAACASAE